MNEGYMDTDSIVQRARIMSNKEAFEQAEQERKDILKEEFITSFEVRGPRILVEVDRPKSEKESSILLLEDTKKSERHGMVRGIVRGMGNTCYNLDSHTNPDTGSKEKWVSVGDVVWFSQYSGSRVLEEGCEFLYVLNDEDIWGRKRATK